MTAYEASLNLLAMEFRERREAEDRQATAAVAPKQPLDKYPQTVGALMRVCEVMTEANLPELWMVMANASKKECIVGIQALADNRAAEASSSREAPIIMPEIYECLNSAQVGGLDLDNVTVGLSPFLMHVGCGAEAKSARE